jgi:hypothetical protein
VASTVASAVPAPAVALRAVAGRLAARLDRWAPASWAARTASGKSRADVVHDVVQRLADLTADLEGQPHRPVPRLDNDLALSDQLRVMVADLLLSATELTAGGSGAPAAAGHACAMALHWLEDVQPRLTGPPDRAPRR